MIRAVLRAFKYRNYRLFFGGQSLSLIGTWIQQVAVSWLTYRLTHSAFILGSVSFSGQIMTFLLSPLAGVYADRTNRHRLLILTQAACMIQSLVLFGLSVSGKIQIWHLFAMNFFSRHHQRF